jgi:TonB family protein
VLRLSCRSVLKTMSTTSFHSEEFRRSHERRRFPRVRLPSLAYVDVDADNGGILLNLSGNGLALQAVSPFVGLTRVSLSIQPPKPRKRIDVSAEITWLSESKTEAGLHFLELAEDIRVEIANWISAEGCAREPRPSDDSSPPRTARISSAFYPEETPARRRKWSFLLESLPAEDALANQKAPDDILDPSMGRENLELHSDATPPEKPPDIPTFHPNSDDDKIHTRTSNSNEQPNGPTIFSEYIQEPAQSPSFVVPPPPAAASTLQSPSSPSAELMAKHDETPDTHIPISSEEFPRSGERRRFTRQRLCSLAYLDIGPDNGGMVLNLSESGLALQTFNPLIGQTRLSLRIQPPRSRKRIEATAELAWLSDSKREAGLKFIELAEDARVEIAEWLSLEAGVGEPPLPDDTASRQMPQVSPEEVSPAPAPEKRYRIWEEPAPLIGYSNLRESPAHQNLPNDPLNISTGCENFELQSDSAHSGKFSDDPTNIPDSYERTVHQRASNVNELTINSTAFSEPVPNVRHPPVKAPPPPTAASRHLLSDRFRKWGAVAALCACVALIFLFLGMAISRGLLSDHSRRLSAEEHSRDASASSPAPTALDASPGRTVSPSEAASSETRHADVVGVLRPPHIVISHKHNHQNSQPGMPNGETDAASAKLLRPAEPLQQTTTSDAQNIGVPSLPVRTAQAASTHRPSANPPAANPVPARVADRRSDCYLLYRVEPLYPREAREQHIEGTVTIHLLIGSDGRVRSLRSVSGPEALVPAALAAAREWRFLPALLNGQPIDTEKDVGIEFQLSR